MTAYLVGRITVTDPQDYQEYARQSAALAEQYGGRFLANGSLPRAARRLCWKGTPPTGM